VDRKPLSDSDAKFLRRLGCSLRMIRRKQGLSQEQFAEKLKLSREGYANYERGKREMGVLVARRIRLLTHFDPIAAPDRQKLDLVDNINVAKNRNTVNARGSFIELGARTVSEFRKFENETITTRVRFFLTLRENASVALGIFINLTLYFDDPSSGGNLIVSANGFILVLSFVMATLLMTSQVIHVCRFVRWRQRSSQLS